jgi:L-amino acid N-acyltransferase YncA
MLLAIRPATIDDAAGLLEVLNPIIETRRYTVLDTPFTPDQERAFVAAFPACGVLHVAERGAEVVGFQSVEPFADPTHAFDHVGVIGTFVRLDMRRQGVGRALFAATLAAARGLGYEKLSTFIRADNPAALAAYGAQGFRTIGVASPRLAARQDRGSIYRRGDGGAVALTALHARWADGVGPMLVGASSLRLH